MALLGAMALPATASAGTVEVTSDSVGDYDVGTSIQFDGAPRETNKVTVTSAGGGVVVRDSETPLTPGKGCTAIDASSAQCPGSADVPIAGAFVKLGDGNDTAKVIVQGWVVLSVDGGGGGDLIDVSQAKQVTDA